MKKIFTNEMLDLINLGGYEEVVNIPIGFGVNYDIVVFKERNGNKLIAAHVIETKGVEEWRECLSLDINPTTFKYYDRYITFIQDVYPLDEKNNIQQIINFNNFLLGSTDIAEQHDMIPQNLIEKEREIRIYANSILEELL